jgi:hypothetical protein
MATPRADLAEHESALRPAQRKLRRGLWGWGLGERIITLAIDGGTMVTDTALQRIAEAACSRYVRVHLPQPAGVAIDIATPAATRALRQIGVDRGRDAQVQRQLAYFFQDTEAS